MAVNALNGVTVSTSSTILGRSGLTAVNGQSLSAGGGFSPSDIAGLQVWLEADALSLSDGDPVSTWTDSSGNGYAPTQSGTKRPTYETNVLNSLPVVRFDAGLNQTLINTSQPSISQPFTVVIVGMWTGTDGQPFTDGGNGSSRCHAPFIFTNKPSLFSGSAVVSATNTISSNTYYVWTSVINGASSKIYQNGQDAGASGNPGSSALTGLALGSNEPAGGVDNLGGDIAEVLVYDSALGTSDRESLEDYLGSKYAITITH